MAGRFTMPTPLAFDSSGNPGAGDELYFYETGTSTPLDTYSDDDLSVANANPVVADSAGRWGDIFLKAQDYKVVWKDSDGVTIKTWDPVRAAEPDSTVTRSISTTDSQVASDKGKLILANATSGAFTHTLLAAATAGDGFEAFVKKTDSSANAVTVDGNGSETIDGESDVTLANQFDVWGGRSDGTSWQTIIQPLSRQNVPLGRGYIDGLVLSNNSSDSDHDIDISAGMCRDGADATNIILSSAITKRIDASWAVGTNNGGLDTGTVTTSTWYHVWAIRRSDTGVVDVLFSTSATAPTMPGSYDQKRRIGAVLTDGSSNIIAFLQRPGGYFDWVTPIIVNDASPTASDAGEAYTVSVPPSTLALVCVNATASDAASVAYFRATDITDDTPVQSGGLPLHNAGIGTTGPTAVTRASDTWIWADASSQIQGSIDSTSGSASLSVMTKGWWDPRGQDA